MIAITPGTEMEMPGTTQVTQITPGTEMEMPGTTLIHAI